MKISYKIIDSAGIYIDESKSFIQLPKPIPCDIPIGDVVKELVDLVASKSRMQSAYNVQRRH